jgi:recombinational DNA repair protein RecR
MRYFGTTKLHSRKLHNEELHNLNTSDYYCGEMKEVEMGKACSTYGRDEKCLKVKEKAKFFFVLNQTPRNQDNWGVEV